MFRVTSEFDPELLAFEKQEKLAPAPRGAVLFYGSSSIRLWTTLAEDLAGLPVVNRGFGGSTLAACVHEMERLIYHLEPRLVVLYAGENDLDQGSTPERVRELFEEFMRRLSQRLGPVPVVFISLKPSPARAWALGQIRRANELVREAIAAWPQVTFLDIFPQMLGPDGKARRELFSPDWLHMSPAGYELWTAEMRACLTGLGHPP